MRHENATDEIYTLRRISHGRALYGIGSSAVLPASSAERLVAAGDAIYVHKAQEAVDGLTDKLQAGQPLNDNERKLAIKCLRHPLLLIALRRDH